jgi:hypothetical protein
MAETSAAVLATGRTSQTCREAGPYRSSRNAQVVLFLKPGERFPADTDGAETTWTMEGDANEAASAEI